MREIVIAGEMVTETRADSIVRFGWNDVRVYRMSLESYRNHVTNSYLILDNEATLIDVSLDVKKARSDLEAGFEAIRTRFEEDVGISDVSGILITHGHADHWGMLASPMFKGKKVYIHESDTRVLKDFRSVYAGARERIKRFVNEAGWDLETENVFSLDTLHVDLADYDLRELHDGQRIINGYQVFHVPGHSPGHVLLKLGPILFLGDHILSNTTPHQLPGSLIEGCGLRLYLSSLKKTAALGQHLGLAAHEETIADIPARIQEMEAFHYVRLFDILRLCAEPKGLYRITDDYYRLRSEYINGKSVADLERDDQILALEEIRAHLDYLIEDGHVRVAASKDGVTLYQAS